MEPSLDIALANYRNSKGMGAEMELGEDRLPAASLRIAFLDRAPVAAFMAASCMW
jgi:hypothetical protein